jgi:hypothetical protein
MRKPVRGSYKEAKMIQAKKKAKSFFDYSEKEKREIVETAARQSSRMMQELVQKYEAQKKKQQTKDLA